ncbi:MAG: hypothetical protein WA326_03035, partial [Nitrososphaeraceae archaeon]
PTSTPTPNALLDALRRQSIVANPTPDCVVGGAPNSPDCNDPSLAQFAQTCSNVPITGGGFRAECVVDRNTCAEGYNPLPIQGSCGLIAATTPMPATPPTTLSPSLSPSPSPSPSPTPTLTATPTQTQQNFECPPPSFPSDKGTYCLTNNLLDINNPVILSCPVGYTGTPPQCVKQSTTLPATTLPTPSPSPTSTPTPLPTAKPTPPPTPVCPSGTTLPPGFGGGVDDEYRFCGNINTPLIPAACPIGEIQVPNVQFRCTPPPPTTTPTPPPTTPMQQNFECPPGSSPSPPGPLCVVPATALRLPYFICAEGYTGSPPQCQIQSTTLPATSTPSQSPFPSPTTTPTPTTTGTTTQTTTPTQTITPTPIVITNVKNVNINNINEQDLDNAVRASPDCASQSATIVIGPSALEDGGARILASFDPCILTDGSVVLNLPDEEGIQLVAANIQGGQTTQSVVVPMQKMSPITQGQTLYIVDLSEQITGSDPASGNPATLNGNINALFLRNNGGQNVEFNADNTIALSAILKR